MFLSAILKVYGACLKDYIDSGFGKRADEVLNSKFIKFNQLKGEKKNALEDKDCTLIEPLELASKQEEFLQFLMNAVVNLNDKWGLNNIHEETNTMLHWGSTALAEEQRQFAPN